MRCQVRHLPGYPPAHSPTGASGGAVALIVGGMTGGKSPPYERRAVAATPCERRRVQVGPVVSGLETLQPCASIHRLTSACIFASASLEVNPTVTPISLHPFLKYSSLHEPIQLVALVVEDTWVEPGGTAARTLVSALRMPDPGSPPGCDPQAATQRARVLIKVPRSA